jgi:hypothetical protein
MRKTTKVLINIIVLAILIIPILSLAQETSGLIPCGTVANPAPCDFNSFMALINTIINFVLFKMAVPIAAIMFAYAGFKMVTAGGEAAHARSEAKEIFTNTLFGLILAVAAWLIISTILFILGYDGAWIGLKVGV